MVGRGRLEGSGDEAGPGDRLALWAQEGTGSYVLNELSRSSVLLLEHQNTFPWLNFKCPQGERWEVSPALAQLPVTALLCPLYARAASTPGADAGARTGPPSHDSVKSDSWP